MLTRCLVIVIYALNGPHVSGEHPLWGSVKLGVGVASLLGCGVCDGVASAMSAVDMVRALRSKNYKEAAVGLLDFVLLDIGKVGSRVGKAASNAVKKARMRLGLKGAKGRMKAKKIGTEARYVSRKIARPVKKRETDLPRSGAYWWVSILSQIQGCANYLSMIDRRTRDWYMVGRRVRHGWRIVVSIVRSGERV